MKNKVIIITGAAKGLGFAAANKLAAKQAKLVLVDYNEEALDEAKIKLNDSYPNVEILPIVADVSKEEMVKNYVNTTIEKMERIDGFYNNAGIEGKQASIADYEIDIFQKVIDINLMGVYYGLRHVLPVMKEQGFGKIVNVSSIGGIRGVANQSPYVASKHAVSGITKNAAIEFGQYGVLTNAVAPGPILTPMMEASFKQMNPENPKAAHDEFANLNPTRALGDPKDVANLVAFLLSDENGYINGQTIAIDGGQSNMYGTV